MADVKPTPTQEENDLAAMGEHVPVKEFDGSELDTAARPPEEPEPPPPDPDAEPKDAKPLSLKLKLKQGFTDESGESSA